MESFYKHVTCIVENILKRYRELWLEKLQEFGTSIYFAKIEIFGQEIIR